MRLGSIEYTLLLFLLCRTSLALPINTNLGVIEMQYKHQAFATNETEIAINIRPICITMKNLGSYCFSEHTWTTSHDDESTYLGPCQMSMMELFAQTVCH